MQRLLGFGDRREDLRARFGELRLLRVGARPVDGPRQTRELEQAPPNLGDVAELSGLGQPRVNALAADAPPLQHISAQLGQSGHPVTDGDEPAAGQLADRKLDDLLRRRERTVGGVVNALDELFGVSGPIEQQGGGTDDYAPAASTQAVPAPAMSARAVPAETVLAEAGAAKARATEARSAKESVTGHCCLLQSCGDWSADAGATVRST